MFFTLAFVSLLIERLCGYPQWLVRAIGHPVIWIGTAIGWLDRRLNRAEQSFAQRKTMGAMALLALLTAVVTVTAAISWFIGTSLVALAILAVIASSLTAQKSLEDHVRAVADALDREGLTAGRKAVSMIVGRDPDQLDEPAVCRAAIESLAENFSDGITAPALWLGIGGLAGGAAYKTTNTADSMIGHRNERYEAFGWASARLDDLVNLPASRLTALLFVLACFFVPGSSARDAWKTVWRDAGKHRSPNAGWPEAAMAGALGLALAGPRVYGGTLVPDHFMGAGGRREATASDIRKALKLARVADIMMIALFGLLAIASEAIARA
ncbi:adenosylcobinamide-phosphate synthase CbiB [Neorhizobium sp. NPDC001467]|uniref:adenosylcobinamide-phosphate synthase CbiB n=1 Tax=Neorhizobium sp. NPDC001467 TaxID=3390595 RepID=UPI003CFD6B85